MPFRYRRQRRKRLPRRAGETIRGQPWQPPRLEVWIAQSPALASADSDLKPQKVPKEVREEWSDRKKRSAAQLQGNHGSWQGRGARCPAPSGQRSPNPVECRRAGEGARITTSIKGLAGRFQPDPLAVPIINAGMMNLLSQSQRYHSATAWSAMHVSITTVDRLASPASAADGWLGSTRRASNRPLHSFGRIPDPDRPNRIAFETISQITDPSRWMATHAITFLATSIGNTRQCIMKGVPSFL